MIYGIFASVEQHSEIEQRAWSDLDIAGQLNGPIDAETRLVLRRAIEEARRADKVMRFAGYYALFHAGKLGIASNPETSPQPGDVHSICLPLSTSPEQAERLLQPRTAH